MARFKLREQWVAQKEAFSGRDRRRSLRAPRRFFPPPTDPTPTDPTLMSDISKPCCFQPISVLLRLTNNSDIDPQLTLLSKNSI
ncbi:hypothetical protein J6590_032536 [Homalodisca vitripennis]|nr:hypothetical protein J6590_100687 [Homalodisca vitripennis]KAG8331836.1 hypothetical protein J6590_032536 [Homalodisca vitripennis]